MDRIEESLAAAEEAVQIRRDLVAIRPERYLGVLAASLDNVADGASKLGRLTEALRTIDEVVQIRRALATADARAALPDLVLSVHTMADLMARLNRHAEARQLFDDLQIEHGQDNWTHGIVVLERAWWHGLDGNIAAAIADAGNALQLLEADPVRQADVRRLLRTMRRADPTRFDAAWPPRHGDQPAWLRHLEPNPSIDEVIHDWMECARTGTLADEQAFLVRHGELLSDEAEAAFDRLIDANPGHAGLRSHQIIIRSARSGDVAQAYAQYTEQMWSDEVSTALASWIAAVSHDDLRRRLAEDEAHLLSDEAAAQCDAMIAGAPPMPETLWRIGLLAICRSDGETNAFTILTDRDAVWAMPDRSSLTAYQLACWAWRACEPDSNQTIPRPTSSIQ